MGCSSLSCSAVAAEHYILFWASKKKWWMSSDWLQVSLRAGFLPSCHWLYFSIHISYFSHLRKHLWYSLSQLQLMPPQLQAGYKPHYSVQDIYQKPSSEKLVICSNSAILNFGNAVESHTFFWLKSCECPPCFPLFMVVFTTRAPNSHPTRPTPRNFQSFAGATEAFTGYQRAESPKSFTWRIFVQRTPGWHLALLKKLGEF